MSELKFSRRQWLAGGIGLATGALLPSTAMLAETYPNRAIQIIVPTGAGGITDILARLIGKSVSEQLHQPVVIENRPGAAGVIGTQAAARAQPDGYTLLMVFPSHAANPSLYEKLPYDSEKSFAPISMVTKVVSMLLVSNSCPAKSVKELIDLARNQSLSFSSVGTGSIAHLSAELFQSIAGVKLVHVPYAGVPQAFLAVVSGEVTMFFDTPITALPQIKAGTVRVLGISTTKRLAVAPEIPTIAESGLPGFEATGWNGLLAPAGTPREIVDKLNDAVIKALATDEIKRTLADQGLELAGNSPDEFARIMHDDIQKWGRVVREAGIKPQ